MEEFLSAEEARDLARLGELKNTLQDRWFAVMKDIRDAATQGLWSLGTLIEMDIIVRLEEIGYRVKYMKGVSWHTATRALISWD